MKLKTSQLIQKEWSDISRSGFSLVEVVLASSLFGLLVTALVGAYLYGLESNALAGNRAHATLLAEEGLEAVRNIRDGNFSNLTTGTYGLEITGSQWTFSGSSDTNGIYTRVITISDIDVDRKSVTSSVTWQQNLQRNGSVILITRLTYWQKSATVPASCNDYAVSQGYSSGTCRENVLQCPIYGETYLLGGETYCTGGPSADTCCAML
ncbi:hypothetical protein A2W32_05190 [candidate division WWE3 bacterium RBG_16_37_10]|uniref:Type II secretion system protein n=1 Tax=candidate division WWE3 bacterium RBG_16_37_10 TaxID=1802610 RepID=A0A1F4UU84_UNCKA|nr:MAG: hypothetical protein A2W32_05190 [candidate division WWE3 bacterium RBG_16_37_10]